MTTLLSFLRSALPVFGTAVLLAAGACSPLRADICDEIGDLGEKWHSVADYIDKHSDDGKLRKAEAAKVRESVHKFSPQTSALAKALVTNLNGKSKDEVRARSLGKQLQANLDEMAALGDGDTWDDVGEIVTKIGDILSKVSDLCSDGK